MQKMSQSILLLRAAALQIGTNLLNVLLLSVAVFLSLVSATVSPLFTRPFTEGNQIGLATSVLDEFVVAIACPIISSVLTNSLIKVSQGVGVKLMSQ